MAITKKVPKYSPGGTGYLLASLTGTVNTAPTATIPPPPPPPVVTSVVNTAPTATTPPPPPPPVVSNIVFGQLTLKLQLTEKSSLTRKNTISANGKKIGRKRVHGTDMEAKARRQLRQRVYTQRKRDEARAAKLGVAQPREVAQQREVARSKGDAKKAKGQKFPEK